MAYLFNTPEQQQEMLDVIGVSDLSDLLNQVPEELQLGRPLDLPPALSEMELGQLVGSIASRNGDAVSRVCMLGGGAYDHFIPSVVDEITSRGEYYTAYTPYQAEASQGSLQAFFEFQSFMCELTGMDVSNASLYEGGTSVSEAAFMAMRVTRRHNRIVVLGSVHPEYRKVLETYVLNLDCEIVVVPTPNGFADPDLVNEALDDKTACLIIQHPNFFGGLEEIRQLTQIAREHGALSVVSVDPISLGVLERPGDYGADIVVAEGQPLGIPLQYGGPYLGILACRQEFVRKMPGRLIGQTKDRFGNSCFVLNLQAREQHIRRDKATSNICTNQGLLALRATVYLSLMGPAGLREVSELCCQKAHYAADQLSQLDGVELKFARPYFKEFVIHCANGAEEFQRKAAQAKFDVGPILTNLMGQTSSNKTKTGKVAKGKAAKGKAQAVAGQDDAWGIEAENCLLVAVTEQRTKEEIDRLVEAVR